MPTFQGKLVSASWKVVLDAAVRDGVHFQLNSGRRTEAEQRALIRQKGVWSPSNPTGAAAYSPNAPHIRVGREDHALDVDTFAHDNGNARLTNWLRSKGLRVDHEIPQEPWHMEASSEVALVALAKRLNKWAGYPADEVRWITEYDGLKRAKKNKPRRNVLRSVMIERRKEIWREAKKTGWRTRNRIKRYASLRARTI